jgi:hypothetical protein
MEEEHDFPVAAGSLNREVEGTELEAAAEVLKHSANCLIERAHRQD